MFFNTLTAYHMFSLQIWEKSSQQVQTQLSSKLKFLLRFWNLQKLLHITKKKKKDFHSLMTTEIIDTEECGSSNAWKLYF